MTNKEAIEHLNMILLRSRSNKLHIITHDEEIALDLAIKELEERPQGEWIYGEDEHGQDGWFCSECRFFVPWYYEFYENDIDFIREYKACPHCLADMVTYTGKDRDMKGGADMRKKEDSQ